MCFEESPGKLLRGNVCHAVTLVLANTTPQQMGWQQFSSDICIMHHTSVA